MFYILLSRCERIMRGNAQVGRYHRILNYKYFTLVELLVVIAIISMLACLLLPVLKISKDKARQISCVSNLKNVSIGVMSYSNDYYGYAPSYYQNTYSLVPSQSSTRWGGFLFSLNYLPDKNVFYCPVDFEASRKYVITSSPTAYGYICFSYGMRTSLGEWYRIQRESTPSTKIVIGDSMYYMTYAGYNQWCHTSQIDKETVPGSMADRTFILRHHNTCNTLMADGHVGMMTTSAMNAGGITGGRLGNYLPCLF